MALQRAQQLLKSFKPDQTFLEEHQALMQDVLAKGYAEVVPQEQLVTESGKVWYIPHHGVDHPRKKKLRVVLDCGATFHGTSLNGELLQGPDLTNKLIGESPNGDLTKECVEHRMIVDIFGAVSSPSGWGGMRISRQDMLTKAHTVFN